MKSNEEEDDDHKGKVKKRSGDEMGPTPKEERSSHKMKTTATFNANSPNNKSNVAKMPSDSMTKQETDATPLFSILPKIYNLESLLADLAHLEREDLKPSVLWGCPGAIYSEGEEISRKIYKRAWKVKKIPDDDDGPMFVWALCVVVEHLTQCIHRKRCKLSELDKKIVSMMGHSLQSIHGNIEKKQDLVLLMDNLKLSLFKNIDFASSIAANCNIDGSKPGESECNDTDTAKEREKDYLEMLSR